MLQFPHVSGFTAHNAQLLRKALVDKLPPAAARVASRQLRARPPIDFYLSSTRRTIITADFGLFLPVRIEASFDTPWGLAMYCPCLRTPNSAVLTGCEHLTQLQLSALHYLESALCESAPDARVHELLHNCGHPIQLPLVAADSNYAIAAAKQSGRPLDSSDLHFLTTLKFVFNVFRTTGIADISALLPTDFIPDGMSLREYIATRCAEPPLFPLQFWSICAKAATDDGINIPAPRLALANLTWATDQLRRRTEEIYLKLCMQRFQGLGKFAGQNASQRELLDLRLRVPHQGRLFIDVRRHPEGPFEPVTNLRDNDIHFLFNGSAATDLNYSARTLSLRCFFDIGLELRLSVDSTNDRSKLAKILSHPEASLAIYTEDGRQLQRDPSPIRWRISHGVDHDKLVVDYQYADGRPIARNCLLLEADPAVVVDLDAATYSTSVVLATPGSLKPTTFPTRFLRLPTFAQFLADSRATLPNGIETPIKFSYLHAAVVISCPALEAECDDSLDELKISVEGRDDASVRRARLVDVGWEVEQTDHEVYSVVNLDEAVRALRKLPSAKWQQQDTERYLRYSLSVDTFPALSTWIRALPKDIIVELDPSLAHLARAPRTVPFALSISPAASNIDWFDVSVTIDIEETFTSEELALLKDARGQPVRLGRKGWRWLDFNIDPKNRETFEALGIDPSAALRTQAPLTLHALQLAHPGTESLLNEQQWKSVCESATRIARPPRPELSADVLTSLRPYQHDGVEFLSFLSHNHFGGILADDMGLGKTLQTLIWLLLLKKEAGEGFKGLVICPKSVKDNWVTEASTHLRGLSVSCTQHPSKFDTDILVINYAQLRNHAELLANIRWTAVVLDEGQFIKNPSTGSAKSACALMADNRLVLTGTPIENRLLDLWSLFHFAQPGLLGTHSSFKALYRADENGSYEHAKKLLAARVKHFILRRTKKQVAPDLPARIEEDLHCELTPQQRKLYDAEFKRARLLMRDITTNTDLYKARFHVFASLLRLRQICCHPRLVGSTKADSGKFDALLERVETISTGGNKVLIFSQWVGMLDIISRELRKRKIAHVTLTGDTENRKELVTEFQTREDLPVFLISLRAGGTGLNLTAASYVILFDPWWNPAVEAQAIDRTHRIGQTSNVIAYRFITKDTVEEKIRQMQRDKTALSNGVVNEDDLASVLDINALRTLLS